MSENDFWDLIEKARHSASRAEEIPPLLVDRLKEMPEGEIVEFGRLLRAASRRAYDWRLWAAAVAILDYCSDDVFYEFRAWLIAQGKSVYERALADPDSLADLQSFDGEDGVARLDSMAASASRAYQAKTGRKDFGERLEKVSPPVLRSKDAWNGEAEMLKEVVPRLCVKFAPKP